MFRFGRREVTDAGDCGKRNRKKRRRGKESKRAPSLSQIDELVTIDQLRIITSRTHTQHLNHSTDTGPIQVWQDWQATNGENFSPYSISGNGENHLPSTQAWRNLLLFNNGTQDAPLLISEEIFRENVNDLLNGIDECAGNPAQWSRERTNSHFDKIQRFLDSWKRQLMKEKEIIDLEALLLRRKLENKQDLVTNRLNILNGVFHESIMFMEFSEFQKQTMHSQVEELNDVRSSFGDSGQLVLSESSLAKLKTMNHELIEARQQANGYREEPRKMQDSLKEANLKLNNLMHPNNSQTKVDQQVMLEKCLQDKEKELNELKKQLDLGAQKQIKTENELIEIREQFKSFVVKSMEMTQTKQKEVNKMLYEIQTSLWEKNHEYRPSCQTENESLNEEKIFQDIKALIEYDSQSVTSDKNCKKNTTESAIETNSGSASLRVSEYEMHLVTLISIFLKVTPFPVKSSYIYSYVANIDNIVDLHFVENLLRKFPSFFKEVAAAPGSMDSNWTYLDLKPVITI